MPGNPNLQKIIKLTQTQYDNLSNGYTITSGSSSFTGLNDNYLYLIQDETEYLPLTAGVNKPLSGALHANNGIYVNAGVIPGSGGLFFKTLNEDITPAISAASNKSTGRIYLLPYGSISNPYLDISATLTTGTIAPNPTNKWALGTSTKKFTDLYLTGTLYATKLNNGSNITIPNLTGTISLKEQAETFTGAKTILVSNTDQEGTQFSNLKVLDSTDATTEARWRGRILAGAKNRTFLLGVYNNMCGIGAHSWTDSNAGTGAAWDDIYINPDGTANVYIGGAGWTASSGILKVSNSDSKLYYNKGTAASPTWKELATTDIVPTMKTLKTNNTTAQSTSSSEALTGSGTINLHKVAKTGTYTDLLSRPQIMDFRS